MGNPFLVILLALGIVTLLAGLQVIVYFWLEGKDDQIR